MLLMSSSSLKAQVPSYVPTNGLVGWWPFNGNANDESGNGNNGTVNGATLTSDRLGNLNKAFNFNGTNFITVPDNNLLDLTDNFSISSWFNAYSFPGNTFGGPINLILCKRQNIPSNIVDGFGGYGVWESIGSHVLSTQSFPNAGPQNYASSTFNIQNSIWYNYVATYDDLTDSLKYYLNGNLIFTEYLPLEIQNNSYDMYIGALGSNPTYFWDGVIDDIGIWNRALTQQEITALYNGCQLSINTQPINQTITVNNNAQFALSSSDLNATYQWQTDLGVGFQNLSSVGQYSGANNDTLTVSYVTFGNNNQPFRCIINSGSCSDTSNVAVLAVNNNVGINEISNNNLFAIYPNPANAIINVKSDAQLIRKSYFIFDNLGKTILTGKITSENMSIDINNLSEGNYLIGIDDNSKKQSFKVIKN